MKYSQGLLGAERLLFASGNTWSLSISASHLFIIHSAEYALSLHSGAEDLRYKDAYGIKMNIKWEESH